MFLLLPELNNVQVQNETSKISILEAMRKGMSVETATNLIKNDAIGVIETEIQKQAIQKSNVVLNKDYAENLDKRSSLVERKLHPILA